MEKTSVLERSMLHAEGPGRLSRLHGLAVGSVLVLIGQGLCLFSGVLSNFLVARFVGPDGKGIIYLIQIVSGVALIVCNCGVGIAGVYQLGRHTNVREVASAMLLLSLAGGVLPILICGLGWAWIVPAIHPKIPAHFMMIALLSIPFLVLSWNASYFELGRHEVKTYNVLRIAQPFVFAVLLSGAFFSSYRTLNAVAALWLLSVLVSGSWAAWLLARIGVRWIELSVGLIADMFRFGFHSQAGAITQYLQHRIDVLLIAYFLPLRDIGIYSLAISFAELLWNVPHAVGAVLMPHVANASEQQARNVTPLVCRITFLVGGTLSFFVVLLGAAAISFLLPAFRQSIPLLWLLLPGVVAAIIFKVLISDYSARGKPLSTLYPASGSLVFAILLGIYFIPRYGIKAAATITSLSYILNAALFLIMYVRETGTPFRKMVLFDKHDLAGLYVGTRLVLTRALERVGLIQSTPVSLPEA